ncbi:hypothetical protein O1611_g3570 [Lasiodiplodia mahajangana]|uniref:Uncharacterized protein n=1 Tax=Lasiodiplodia mahajangana TaxID=1108764 RepID=A0ACC2JRJ8_9PEZI|nr:hypothetical protein O1611_g3570 [Lasiodiplodia mahajangana]
MPSATSSKRSRRVAFNEDASADEYTVTETAASSSLRNETQRKKARLSSGNSGRKPHRAIDAGDSDGDEPMVEAEDEATPPPATHASRNVPPSLATTMPPTTPLSRASLASTSCATSSYMSSSGPY